MKAKSILGAGALALLAGLALFVGCQPAGIVSDMEPGKLTITDSQGHNPRTYDVAADVKVTRNGAATEFNNLVLGDKVQLTTKEEGQQTLVTAITVTSSASAVPSETTPPVVEPTEITPLKPSGEKAASPAEKPGTPPSEPATTTPEVTVPPASEPQPPAKAPDAATQNGGEDKTAPKAGSPADSGPAAPTEPPQLEGERTAAESAPEVIPPAKPADVSDAPTQTIEGEIFMVSAQRPASLLIKGRDKAFSVTDNADIMLDGQKATLAQLRAGQLATVKVKVLDTGEAIAVAVDARDAK